MLNIARYGTSDLDRAKKFYDAIAGLLGAKRVTDRPEVVGYRGAEGGMFLIGTPYEGETSAGNGTQIGFMAASRDIVDAVHAKAIELGGECVGPPGVRGPDPNGFYGAYFRDLDGNKVMIFRFGPP
jgi:catechol 2,3-dioxygenase-like lactoylglutathione lyase family enzyme